MNTKYKGDSITSKIYPTNTLVVGGGGGGGLDFFICSAGRKCVNSNEDEIYGRIAAVMMIKKV